MLNTYDMFELDAGEDNSRRLPEHNLLIALLNRALLDYLGSSGDDHINAGEWLFAEDDAEDTFSYRWVCDHLGLEPDFLLGGVRVMREESNGKVKRWYLQRGKSDQIAA
ncbi:MAG: hypothetical protein KDD66_06550 [Bdellovibrionales bacterium]|nr:hypothetical protein [Bdellovibrionales bacterium]